MRRDMANKILSISLIIAVLAFFIASTIIFFVNRGGIEYYSVNYNSYNNVANIYSFQEEIKIQTGIDFEDIFLKNGGEIRTDAKGNIIYFNLDCTVEQTDKVFGLQIQSSEKSEYKLISEKTNRLKGDKISVKEILETISYWNFNSDYLDVEYKFMIGGELIQNIQKQSSTKQYIVLENGIEELKFNLNGLFSRITILCNDSFQELYYQVK